MGATLTRAAANVLVAGLLVLQSTTGPAHAARQRLLVLEPAGRMGAAQSDAGACSRRPCPGRRDHGGCRSRITVAGPGALQPALEAAAASVGSSPRASQVGQALGMNSVAAAPTEAVGGRHRHVGDQLLLADSERIRPAATRPHQGDHPLQAAGQLAAPLSGRDRRDGNRTLWIFLAGAAAAGAVLLLLGPAAGGDTAEAGGAQITGAFPTLPAP